MSLYSTPTATVRGIQWRFAIREQDARGEYQFLDQWDRWIPFCLYEHRRQGLVTLNELDRALYQPHRASIAQARASIDRMGRDFTLQAQAAPQQHRLI